ncbi:Membrane-anchored protein [Sulfitobacter noctilucicola]|uniref:Putative glycosyltransferase n=1 Tax=Sulfitobacter noctilucicola TaxID=1342301 RepID=A0A7W6Q6R1_9RHOB|nr:membrane protein [Sulfitobacter noctilucicola]KIN63427.1 Membrane-anchored protein [Sulfitobacter noctilucicola]MBB4175060.1 putative glycosyltransferase [Sulfitobacter noctilucicola]
MRHLPATAQGEQTEARRVILYSHDTFGLGHLRRSRALATALTQDNDRSSAIILTGSPVAGRFTFPERVDHIRLPGVTKLQDGTYVSQAMGLDIDDTTSIRAGLIQSAIERYEPDLLIVDKEPTGFRGELLPSLEYLRMRGRTRVVLGLRDVLDEPEVLEAEWARKGAVAATENLYDEIWVYGVRDVYDPTEGLPLSDEARARIHWTGYLRRQVTDASDIPQSPYILVTPGGGGDGAAMVSLVLSAYEQDPDLGPDAMLIYGPFLSGEVRDAFDARVAKLNGRVTAVGFDSRIEALFAGAVGVVCMGGYNTFCEVLSFDKPAVILPRTKPRLEQWIRASRAEGLGLVRMLDESRDGMTTDSMIRAIRALPDQRKPSEAGADGLLDGLGVVVERARRLMEKGTVR